MRFYSVTLLFEYQRLRDPATGDDVNQSNGRTVSHADHVLLHLI
jgi:hypothetical protein